MSDNRERANLIFDRIPNIECLKNCNLSRLKISKARNIFLLFVDWNKIEFIHTCFQIMNIDINDIFISIKYAWFNERLIKSTDIWFKWTKSLDFLYTKEFNYSLFKYNDYSTITGSDLDSVFLTFFSFANINQIKIPARDRWIVFKPCKVV